LLALLGENIGIFGQIWGFGAQPFRSRANQILLAEKVYLSPHRIECTALAEHIFLEVVMNLSL